MSKDNYILISIYEELKQEHSRLEENYDKLYNSYVEEQNNRIEIAKKYHLVHADNNQSLALNDQLHKQALKLRAEIRSLQRHLRDANRGAERLHLMNAQLRIELIDYKLKHPETITTT